MKPGLWNVRGVDAETRKLAKTAAKHRKQSMGVWLTQAIRIHAEGKPATSVGIVKAVCE